jgi:hypothetical protein
VFLSGINSSKTVAGVWKMVMTVLITFAIKGVVHFGFVPQGQTGNQAYGVEILKQLYEAVRRKSPELVPTVGFSPMTMLQLNRYSLSSSFWSRNRLLKWNTHPFHLIWLQMTSDCLHKVCCKGMKISGY